MKVGDVVYLKEDKEVVKQFAVIDYIYSDNSGGVHLDRRLKDFHSWNIIDLVKVGEISS